MSLGLQGSTKREGSVIGNHETRQVGPLIWDVFQKIKLDSTEIQLAVWIGGMFFIMPLTFNMDVL